MEENYISQIRELLKLGGFSQLELAKRLGVTFAALNRWLHGHSRPRPARIRKIHRLYKELIGYPAITQQALFGLVRTADAMKRKGLWDLIGKDQGLQDELLLEHTYNSTTIEGTTFTKKETEVVIFKKAIIPEKSLTEHLEVTNHAAVLKSIFQKKYRGPVTEDLVKELHLGLMQGIREDAGNYSKHPLRFLGVPVALTHPEDIPEEMGHLIMRWKKFRRKTVQEISLFHIQFELIHPFGDGNGRVGRLLMTLQCLQQNFPPVVIENARKAEYYDVLEYAQRKSEGPFIAFLVDEMKTTHQLIQKYHSK